MSLDNLKIESGNYLLRWANIKRVHIVGCSRSGTTMLHYMMSAFQNTVLFDKETSPWSNPGFLEILKLFSSNILRPNRKFLVTKRSAGWYEPSNFNRFVEYVRRHELFVIYIIRDPRDVLTSTHQLDSKEYYVSLEFWKRSIEAGERILETLQDYNNKLVVRYEDIVRSPSTFENQLNKKFGLQKRINVESIDKLKDNIEKSDLSQSQMIPYMHKLRNLDVNSIGRWQNDPQKEAHLDQLYNDSDDGEFLKSIISKYQYNAG